MRIGFSKDVSVELQREFRELSIKVTKLDKAIKEEHGENALSTEMIATLAELSNVIFKMKDGTSYGAINSEKVFALTKQLQYFAEVLLESGYNKEKEFKSIIIECDAFVFNFSEEQEKSQKKEYKGL